MLDHFNLKVRIVSINLFLDSTATFRFEFDSLSFLMRVFRRVFRRVLFMIVNEMLVARIFLNLRLDTVINEISMFPLGPNDLG